VHIDPTQNGGADVALVVIDRVRTEMLHRARLDELLIPVKSHLRNLIVHRRAR
jgi:hypothetical protein